jgi:two-component system, chemotaxis family, response regulator Rcp1
MSPVEILLVEDNPGDVRLTREALRESSFETRLSVAVDGVEALRFLRREGSYAGAPRPDLILLDLNLPRKDGRAVLAELKQDGDFRRIPVAVLTTSDADRDVLSCYDLRANCYIVKPLTFDRFVAVVRAVEDFWFALARRPAS